MFGVVLLNALVQFLRVELRIVLVDLGADGRMQLGVKQLSQHAEKLGRCRKHELPEPSVLMCLLNVMSDIAREVLRLVLGRQLIRLVAARLGWRSYAVAALGGGPLA